MAASLELLLREDLEKRWDWEEPRRLDYSRPGLSRLGSLTFFTMSYWHFAKCLYLQYKARVLAWELEKVSAYSGFFISPYYGLR